MHDEPLRKVHNGPGVVEDSRPARRPLNLIMAWVVATPFLVLLALVLGVAARLCLIAFEFGWQLFGWAT